MGYCIKMTDSKFGIKKENFENALKALKKVFIPEEMTVTDFVKEREIPHFRWVSTDAVLNTTDILNALMHIRYKPVLDENGDIANVEFTGEKSGDERVFFTALAPFVEKGSYLAFEGEDGNRWTWKFDGKTVTEELWL